MIIHGDCIEELRKLQTSSVDLVFADPPFNIKYDYGTEYKDILPDSQYLSWMRVWIAECYRVLKPSGSMFVAHCDKYVANVKLNMDEHMYMRNWIIWRFAFGVHMKVKFTPCHRHILYYSKHKSVYTFRPTEVAVPSARQTVYNDKRANSGGKTPEDVWDFPRVCGTHAERLDHPCQMPEAVLERIIKATTYSDDTVLDPFGGSGTTAAVAKRLGRRFITIEQSQKFVNIIRSRVNGQVDGTIPANG